MYEGQTPKFTTRIDATGPGGNINVILANAVILLRQIKVSEFDINDMRTRVNTARSYLATVEVVRAWFLVDLDDD